MKLRRWLSSSLRPLLAHRTRALLSGAGVAVGVAAILVSQAIGTGAEEEMRRTVEGTGTNLLIVKPLPLKPLVSRPKIGGLAMSLTVEDSNALARLPGVAAVAPAIERPARVKVGAIAMRTTARGTTVTFPAIRRFALAEGRFFNAADDRAARRVAVLGDRIARELSPEGSLVGAQIRIDGIPFDVVGVFRARGTTTDGADQDNQVAIPLRTALRRVFNATWLTNIYVSAKDPNEIDAAATEIQQSLRQRHRRGDGTESDDFAVQSTARTRAFQQQITASLSRYAAALSTIALGVGSMGILATMLLSVRERTAEIGLRMAVGAQRRDILLQFLLEATVLSLGGWISGAIVAVAAAAAIVLGTNWPIAFPTIAIAASLGMALIIGLGFGVLPARNAARIAPLQALLTR